jgi:hypothetical protein
MGCRAGSRRHPAYACRLFGGCGDERCIELASIQSGGLVEPDTDRGMGDDDRNCRRLQLSAGLYLAASKALLPADSDFANDAGDRLLPYRGHRFTTWRIHPPAPAQSGEPCPVAESQIGDRWEDGAGRGIRGMMSRFFLCTLGDIGGVNLASRRFAVSAARYLFKKCIQQHGPHVHRALPFGPTNVLTF